MPEFIAERYQIVARIGAGGAGTVYKVFDPLLNKFFAVKVLQQNADDVKAARFQREAKSAGKLNHPHICRIDNFGLDKDGLLYMVMEFLEGRDLGELVDSQGALSLEDVLLISIQLASALSYAHDHGVVHRDLKPANVLLLNDSKRIFIKLLDFGVAKDDSKSGDITQMGAIVGSPLYMSPEQIRGEETGPASDIYSFGCMLFEILTGNPPFRGDSVVETLSMHKTNEAPKLTAIDSFPQELSALVDQCLKKDPLDRPPNFTDILNRLEKIQEDFFSLKPCQNQLGEQALLLENKKSRQKKLILTISACSISLLVACAAVFIGKDIKGRKVLPESKVSGDSGLNQAATEIFDPKEDRKNLFMPDAKLGDLGRRAVPSVVDEDLKLLQGQKLMKLAFDGSQINGSGLKYVLNCGINQLRMQQVEITDENMKYIAQMKDLVTLSINSDFLTDKGLAHIADARKFMSLEIQSDQITNQGIASIRHLDHCKNLSFRGKNLTIDCLKSIGKSKNLQTLELGKFKIEGDLGTLLLAFPRLVRMDFADIEWIDPESLKSLATKKITSVSVMRSTLGPEQIAAFADLKNLVTLSLFKCEVEPESLKSLGRSSSLWVLHLTENQHLSGKGVAYLSRIKHLRVLNLSKSNITPDDMAQLLTMPDLNILDVTDCLSLPKEAIDKFVIDYKARWGRNLELNT